MAGHRRAWKVGIALSALVLTAAAGCGDPRAANSGAGAAGGGSSDEFVVGAVLPLTGNFAVIGESDLVGLRAQIDLVNADGGILGKQVRLEYRDDASDPQRAVAAAQELLSLDGLRAVFPDPVSANTIAQLPVLSQAGMLSVTHCQAVTCTDPQKYPGQFSMSIPGLVETRVVNDYVTQKLGAKKVGVLVGADATGKAFGDAFVEHMRVAGTQPVGLQQFEPGGKDFTSQLQALRGGEPDVIVLQANGAAVGVVMQGLLDLGWDVPVVGNTGVAATDWGAIVPPQAASQLTAVDFAIGGRDGEQPRADYAPFFEAAAKHGTLKASVVGASMADALLAVKYAYEKAGTDDIAAAVAALQGMQTAGDVPADYFWVYRNSSPSFSPTVHNTANADVSRGFYWAVRSSPNVQGTRLGEPIVLG